MSNAIEITTQQVRDIEEHREYDLKLETSKIGFWSFITFSALVGIWGSACLICGLGSCESISAMGRGLFTAITGM